MNREILLISEQLKQTFDGDPWHGRNTMALLGEVDAELAARKPEGGHSILELLWHMITWKEFTISRIRKEDRDLSYFETHDWRKLEGESHRLWQEGLARFRELHVELISLLQQQQDSLLPERVPGRTYDFRKLLHGIVDHDIYHSGQIAIVKKMLEGEE